MSMHIAAMEEELGFKLFDRAGGLTLTREGKLFCERVSELLDDYDALVQRCRDVSKAAPARLVFGESSMIELFPPASVTRFRRVVGTLSRNPSLELISRPLDNMLTIAESFERGLCDASFRTCCMKSVSSEIVELDDGMSVLPLEMDPMVGLVRAGHPLLGLARVTPADVAAYPVPLSTLPAMETYNSTRTDFFAAHGCRPSYRMRTAGTPSAFALPDVTSDEVLLVASTYARSGAVASNPDVRVVSIEGTTCQSCFCLCFPTHAENPAVRMLVDAMRG